MSIYVEILIRTSMDALWTHTQILLQLQTVNDLPAGRTLLPEPFGKLAFLFAAGECRFFEDAHEVIFKVRSPARDGDDAHGRSAGFFQDAGAFIHRRSGGENVVHENQVAA